MIKTRPSIVHDEFSDEVGAYTPKVILCPYCIAEINENWTFCIKCGQVYKEIHSFLSFDNTKKINRTLPS